jgi:hypothetical protein
MTVLNVDVVTKNVDIRKIFDVDEPEYLNAEIILSKENLIGAVYCSLACFCTVHR